METEKGHSDHERAMLELELSDKKLECEMLRNASFDKDTVIEHLKDTIIKSLTSDRQTFNVTGGINMKRQSSHIIADSSNVMVGSNGSSQTLIQYKAIDELLSKIVGVAEHHQNVSKDDFARVVSSVDEIRGELAGRDRNQAKIERSLNALGSISSIASLVGQLSPMLLGLFNA
jgi:hypothetical protein